MSTVNIVAKSNSSPELLKVLAAAHFAGAKVAVTVDPSASSAVSLTTSEGARITDPAALAVFFAPKSADGLKVEDWLVWDQRVLAPAVAKALSHKGKETPEAVAAGLKDASNKTVNASFADLAAAVQHVASALPAGAAGLVGGKLSVADAVIAADCSAPAKTFPLAAVAPSVAALVESVTAQPFFKAAQEAAAKAKTASAAGAGAAAAAAGGGAKKEKAAKGDAGAADAGEGYDKHKAAKGIDFVSLDNGLPINSSDDKLMLTPVEEQLFLYFTDVLHRTFPAAKAIGLNAAIETQKSDKFFHQYQCNSAVQVFGRLKGKEGIPANPRACAEALLATHEAMKKDPKTACALIGKLEVSGPGFLNIYLSTGFLSAKVADLLTKGLRPLAPQRKFSVAVDYSSPNIAKEMHIGHLRSTIIGDTIARILEYCGHSVTRLNHVGDWGTQFGMLLAHLKDLQAQGKNIEGSIGDITNFYKDAKKRFDAEPEFKDRAHKEVVALQQGDPTNRALWQKMIDVSQATYDEVYRRLDVDPRLQLCGESFYNGMIPGVIEELKAKNLVTTSDGALVCKVPGEEVPLMVRKSDGGVGYDSTDLAAIRYRLAASPSVSTSSYSQGAYNNQEVASGGVGGLGCDWLVYVVDQGQALHFDLVFKGAQMAGWYKPLPAGSDYEEIIPAAAAPAAAPAAGAGAEAGASSALIPTHPGAKLARVEHTGFGVIQGEDRKKFKTRSGDTVRLVDVLDEAKERMKTALKERLATGNAGFSIASFGGSQEALEAEVEKTASILGYGGVKYFDLRQHRANDYVFSYERMLSPDGDTAVYLEYAHARLCSILRKAKEQYGATENIDAVLSAGQEQVMVFSHPTETSLVTEILRFTEVLKKTTANLTPHLLCDFVYSVANRTAEFHRDCNVLGAATPADVRASRLRMVLAAQKTIAEVMKLLGITPLERI